MNKENFSDTSNIVLDMSEAKGDKINQLIDELVQAFCPEDCDNTSTTQKEELIPRIIQLGGENYAYEDLRRDIINIQMEDLATEFTSQTSLAKQIPSKVELKEQDQSIIEKKDTVKIAEANLDQLGIYMSQEGPKSPNYDIV